MKHLKIAFAIVFFCLMGGANVELMAQDTFPVGIYSLDDRGTSITYVDYTFVINNTKMKVLNNKTSVEVWSQTFDIKVDEFRITDNGSFLVKGDFNKTIWESKTEGRAGGGTKLKIQADGNLVLYGGRWYGGDGNALWATGTCDGKINGCGETGVR
jgi:hypothetical protein